ncbi:hypothetical protein ACFQFQ_25545 [Sulfitobacter porphyrae]|uniref:HTH lacI-type domain-containing protein n=1 Tax=Sulfitobacter porphyrae TaxID=1246864 RepID=A0ABW2B8I3_9RHOB
MGNETKRTTIYDIAVLAQASPSAVSAVLNGSWQKRRLSKSLAERVLRIAEQEGYAVNAQASLLRRERSHIIGMIVPKYDNRYFGHIAEQFEAMARDRNLFPVVTCTQRDPDLEFEAAKELVSYQAECLISTGATDPDRISAFCKASGVQSINLDLPGTLAPSVISDNYSAARDLTHLIMDRCASDLGWTGPLRFVGGRGKITIPRRGSRGSKRRTPTETSRSRRAISWRKATPRRQRGCCSMTLRRTDRSACSSTRQFRWRAWCNGTRPWRSRNIRQIRLL